MLFFIFSMLTAAITIGAQIKKQPPKNYINQDIKKINQIQIFLNNSRVKKAKITKEKCIKYIGQFFSDLCIVPDYNNNSVVMIGNLNMSNTYYKMTIAFKNGLVHSSTISKINYVPKIKLEKYINIPELPNLNHQLPPIYDGTDGNNL